MEDVIAAHPLETVELEEKYEIAERALIQLGTPNRGVKPTAQDAVDMATFAREALRAIDLVGRSPESS